MGRADFDQLVTFLHTEDLARTARFYETILEIPLVRDQAVCRIYKISPGGYLGFCSHPDTPQPDGIILTLVASNVDEWHTKLLEKGVEITKPPVHNSKYHIYHFFFKDPNGYLLEIQQFDQPLE